MHTYHNTKKQGMSWLKKTGLVLLLTLASSFMMSGGLNSPKSAEAAISQIVTPASAIGTNTPASANVTVPLSVAGNKRMLIVAITVEGATASSGTSAQIPTCTYGGAGNNLIAVPGTDNSATSALEHTYMFYMLENATLMNNTARALTFTINGFTMTGNSIHYAVYDGVDQTALVGGSTSNTGVTNANTTQLASALNIASGDYGFVVAMVTRSASTTPYTIVTPTNWTSIATAAANTVSPATNRYFYNSTTVATTPVALTVTASALGRLSMSGVVISPAVPPVDGVLTVIPGGLNAGGAHNDLSWSAATDASGINHYDLVFATGATPPATCALGTVVPGSPFASTTFSVAHNSLTVGTQYSYRLCATDNTGNTSAGVTVTGTAKWPSTIASCNGCHGDNTSYPDGTARNTPVGKFQGSHQVHAVDSALVCTTCHVNNTLTNHSRGTIEVNTPLTGGGTYSVASPITVSNTFSPGTCSGVYCHSSARSTLSPALGTTQYATTSNWGTIAGSNRCLNCHGGRNPSTGNYASSTSGFRLSTTHSQHLMKYPNINCQVCHSKTAASATALKNFTGVIYHANNKRNVTFTDIGYGSYSSYKNNEAGLSATAPGAANFRKCTNVACHGGTTRSAWSANTTNNDNTCVHCHGTVGTLANVTNIAANWKFFAPGYKKPGTAAGTSTDGSSSSANFRVGAHFKHISSAYMKSIRCNECHRVPSTPFDGANTHIEKNRYGSDTLSFAQASTATITIGVASGSTPTILATFSGYTAGTATKAATCSSVYCHGNRMKTGMASGTYRKPYWNYSAMINYTQPGVACGRCHGYPPTGEAGHVASDTTCNSCHSHVATGVNPGTFINKSLHINGKVESSGSCIGCHAVAKGTRRIIAGVSGEFGRAFGHHDNTVSDADCVVCHMEGNSVADPSRSATYHLGNPGGNIDLRDPDLGTAIASPAAIFARNLNSNVLETFAVSIQNNLCLKCHDADGANYLLGGQTGTDGSHTPSNPFAAAASTPANVDAHFATTNASFHPVKGVQNNANAAKTTTMLAPWNSTTHYLITCFDCHSASGATGAQSSTVVAHGAALNLRATYDATLKSATKLCVVCHNRAIYWAVDAPTANNQSYTHMAGNGQSGLSANAEWASGGRHDVNSYNFYGCTICHGVTTYAGVGASTQALRAENAHGFDTRHNGTSVTAGNWPSGARPWAFIRNTSTLTSDWGPRGYPNAADGNCGAAMCGKGATTTYTPGGSY